MTLLQCFPVSLDGNGVYGSISNHIVGPNPTVSVYQLQGHTPYPFGTFDIVFENITIDDFSSPMERATIPWDASGDAVESAIESIFPNRLVNVPP